jgi:hypothetical protein
MRATLRDTETRVHDREFTEEFDELFDRVAPKTNEWCVARSSAYLNWRFRDHPKTRFTIRTGHQKGRLEAYAITQTRDRDVQIAELFGADDAGILESLLMSVVESARDDQAVTLSAPILSGHPWQRRLEALGFYAREASPVVTYGAESASWLTEGDRES